MADDSRKRWARNRTLGAAPGQYPAGIEPSAAVVVVDEAGGTNGWTEGSEEKPGRGRLGRGVWVAYLSTGAALAVLRVSVLAWWVHLAVTHQMTETVNNLFSCLRPELLLGDYTRAGEIRFSPSMPFYLLWGSVLTLGSFIMATPILLVGWLRQRRR